MNIDNTIALIRAFLELWPDAEFSPAHIALSDYNLSDSNIEFCKRGLAAPAEGDQAERPATALFLDLLLLIPEDVRTACEGEY